MNTATATSPLLKNKANYAPTVLKHGLDSVIAPHHAKTNAIFPTPAEPKFTFIDLFAGIGGFRLALQSLGGECVFSSEWDANAQQAYSANFGDAPFGDITQKSVKSKIPNSFDVLCAGFPCQPFSKGGFQNGFEDTRGTLFFEICEIVERHQPKILLLENVANLVTHDSGNTYQVILKNLQKLGYLVPESPMILSPDAFGVPILRPRVYIPCVKNKLSTEGHLNLSSHLERFTHQPDSIDNYIDAALVDAKLQLTAYEERVLIMWDEFYQGIDLKVIGFPIWSEYFLFKGDTAEFPSWKRAFIEKNQMLYQRNQTFVDQWLDKHQHLDWCTTTHKKLEWQAGSDHRSIFECLIQFRPSGVRVKRPNKFSTLVAMNHQQIIGPLRRRLSVQESQALQSFPKEYQLSQSPAIALKQLGNSVNVKVVRSLMSVLLEQFYEKN